MILRLYCIRDARTGFMPPTAEQSDAAAIRNFEHACVNAQSLFYTHPADYDLCRVGEYDTDLGVITPCSPEPLVNALSIVQQFKSDK